MPNVILLADCDTEFKKRLFRRSEAEIGESLKVAARIIDEVTNDGDKAIEAQLLAIDRVSLSPEAFAVSQREFDEGIRKVDAQVKAAVDHAIRNVRRFHESQLPPQVTWFEVEPGVMAGEKITPVDSIGLYVPRGKGAFPSVMIMLAVPAIAAGVEKIVICTPPNPDGSVDCATLYAARMIGVDRIFKIGGATAIAAMALGTETVPKVAKLLGPGNQYCSAAKRLLSSAVDVGLPAGPSEGMILADESADPYRVSLDLLIEAEHGPDSAAILVTPSENLAHRVNERLDALIEELPEPRRSFCKSVFANYGGIFVTPSMVEAIAFVNEYAPEHMELHVKDPMAVLGLLKNAGEILIGPHTPICLGNYCIGVNAILPTGGFAKSHSCTSVHSFLKRTSLAYCTDRGFESLRMDTAVLAEYEGFPSHARAALNRSPVCITL